MEATTIKKYNKQTVPKLIKKAQTVFNEFIRLRDSYTNGHFRCISCGEIKNKSQRQAGHYYSAGNHAGLRFHEDNCHAQCIKCNMHLHGNLLPYRENLIKKIGCERFEKLEVEMQMYRRVFKWDRFSLIEIIETYKIKTKELKKGL